MSSSRHPVEDLLSRLRRGEVEAARELVTTYEPFVRRAIRPKIVRYNLQALLDSADICQSVLASLLVRMSSGRLHVDNQQNLERLLLGMVRKKLAHVVRREYSQRRDRNRLQGSEFSNDPPGESRHQPEFIALQRDLLEKVETRLNDEERQLLAWRLEGRTWSEIAALTGQSEVPLRQRLSRGLRRAARELE